MLTTNRLDYRSFAPEPCHDAGSWLVIMVWIPSLALTHVGEMKAAVLLLLNALTATSPRQVVSRGTLGQHGFHQSSLLSLAVSLCGG